ncbi:Protein LURP-one-related 6 [Linum grandiflorum]
MAAVAIISKLYCSPSQVVFTVRKRPHVVTGGGFVVTDCSQNVVFRVEGCGVLGSHGELMLRDTHGDALLLIRRTEGVVQALSINRKWKGYSFDYQGVKKIVFKLKEPNSCLVSKKSGSIKISTEPRRCSASDWDFEVKGDFPEKDASIVDHLGRVIAEIGVEKGMRSMDLYYVVVKPGIDQAFVFGVVAVLDNVHGESTTC